VVVPCYNEEEVLPELLRRVEAVCAGAAPGAYEIVLVNDGSGDLTASTIAEASARNPAVVGIDLARNYGHQIALTAGLSFARGARILVIDADLQDPPELLPDMLALMDRGANVVYGRRTDRAGETLFKRVSAKLFYRLLNRLAHVQIPMDTGDFRLMDRQTLDAFLSMPEQFRFIRGMIAWIGLTQVEIPYARQPRHAGTTKYPLFKMFVFALDAFLGFSLAPLRLSMYLALGFIVAAMGLMVYVLVGYFLFDTVHGWASTLFMFLAFSALQLLSLSVIGEYVGRTYVQTKQRPLFIVKEVYAASRPHKQRPDGGPPLRT
jgi:dolichol-phosphate mannosyltransferase